MYQLKSITKQLQIILQETSLLTACFVQKVEEIEIKALNQGFCLKMLS